MNRSGLLARRTCLSVVIAGSMNGCFFHAGAQEMQGQQLQMTLDAALSQVLTTPVSGQVDWFRRADHWTLVCGTPIGAMGVAVDYARTPLAEDAAAGMIDDQFCALFEHGDNGPALQALDVGSTDAPLIGWMEEFGLPASLLAED